MGRSEGAACRVRPRAAGGRWDCALAAPGMRFAELRRMLGTMLGEHGTRRKRTRRARTRATAHPARVPLVEPVHFQAWLRGTRLLLHRERDAVRRWARNDRHGVPGRRMESNLARWGGGRDRRDQVHADDEAPAAGRRRSDAPCASACGVDSVPLYQIHIGRHHQRPQCRRRRREGRALLGRPLRSASHCTRRTSACPTTGRR